MDSKKIKAALKKKEEKSKGKETRKKERLEIRIENANNSPSKVEIKHFDVDGEMTIRPPFFKEYFLTLDFRGFWLALATAIVAPILTAYGLISFLHEKFDSQVLAVWLGVPLALAIFVACFFVFTKIKYPVWKIRITKDKAFAIMKGSSDNIYSVGKLKDLKIWGDLSYSIFPSYRESGWLTVSILHGRKKREFINISHRDFEKVKGFRKMYGIDIS